MKKSPRVTATALVATLSLSWLSAFAAEAPKESECDFQNAHPLEDGTFIPNKGHMKERSKPGNVKEPPENNSDISEE